ncbi:MAG TPA: hypothetical protein VI911_09125 [Patescibacteria group bacterium]|nr:MAG: hypothetical protein UR43_C0005G0008 [candidate division TM6 bacterium GW2011_GWF2_33_332]HLD91160.1 hypothetical protein [Patescibacteria group bacterium]
MDKIYNYEISGIDTKDYPDFCDAYVSYAEHEDGTPLTDEELDEVNESGMVYELVINYLF